MRAQTVHTWGAKQLAPLERLIRQADTTTQAQAFPRAIAITPTGSHAMLSIAVTGGSGVDWFRIDNNTPVKLASPSTPGYAGIHCAISRNGVYAAAVGSSGSTDTGWVSVWRISGDTLTPITVNAGTLKSTTSCFWLPDNKTLAVINPTMTSGTGTCNPIFYLTVSGTTATRTEYTAFSIPLGSGFGYHAASEITNEFALMTTNGVIYRFGMASSTISQKTTIDTGLGSMATYSLAYLDAGKTLAVGRRPNLNIPGVYEYDLTQTTPTRRASRFAASEDPAVLQTNGTQGIIQGFALSPDESRLLVLGNFATRLTYYDTSDANARRLANPDVQTPADGTTSYADWLPDNQRVLVTSTTAPYIHMYLRKRDPFIGWVRVAEDPDITSTSHSCIAINPSGNLVAVGSSIKLYQRTASDAPLIPIGNVSPSVSVSVLAFDRTGNYLFGASGSNLYWWRVNADYSLSAMPAPDVQPSTSIQCLSCSPTADHIYVGVFSTTGAAYYWSGSTLTRASGFPAPGGSGMYASWSADGSRLVYGSTATSQMVNAVGVAGNTFTAIPVSDPTRKLGDRCVVSKDGNSIMSVKNTTFFKATYAAGAYTVDGTSYALQGMGSLTSPASGFYVSPNEKHYLYLGAATPFAAAGALNGLTPGNPEEIVSLFTTTSGRGAFTPDSKNMYVLAGGAPYVHNFQWRG